MEMFMWKETNGYYHDQFACGYGKKVPKMMSSCASPPIALGCIQHSISKMDTLAGIAIKYGVEVADIKKVNGLVTDRQMFALRTLHIPLPGSPIDVASSKLSESFRSLEANSSGQKLTASMNASQGYYGTVPTDLEATTCSKDSLDSATSNRPCHHQKSRSLAESIMDEVMQKSEMEHNNNKRSTESDIRATEILMKEESIVGLPSRKGNSLALRQKSASRIALHMGGDFLIDGVNGVRRSSSTSCLQAQDNTNSSNMRSNSRSNMKQDYFMLFSIPKPTSTGRTSKAAID
ncbi:lysM and putative peptidoglycan-binding domain-containing protein 1-like [Arachis ipaensis]|uniref:lysM and putative peptidoglycan-binding domain-containing protein 1-like n=1 Tax=Arachis ipaensis TaxID=130454 RepID=UPI000A2AF7A5|nr:lysM and putative peptidoglycan-binding domain-containing protein 1-like [Arachis ipaensis]